MFFAGAASCMFPLLPLLSALAQVPKMPMEANFAETTTSRWLNKPVLDSRLLDDMEDPSTWSFEGVGEMSFTNERAIDGTPSLRLRAKTKTAEKPRTPGRAFENALVVRKFADENWTRFNRLSFCVYPDPTGCGVISMIVNLRDAEPERGRTLNYYLLRNREWNHIVWEIPDLARAKVTGVALTYRLQGTTSPTRPTPCSTSTGWNSNALVPTTTKDGPSRPVGFRSATPVTRPVRANRPTPAISQPASSG